MNSLYLLAHAGHAHNEVSSTTLSPDEIVALTAAMSALLVVFIIFSIGAYVIFSICLMKIFAKAGVKPWIAWVPFYNTWKLLEIGGQQGVWAVFTVIPLVNIVSSVFIYIAQYHVGKKLGKGGEFVLWALFFPIVWYIWLAFDKSKWHDKASTAPSLHKPSK